MIGGLGITTNVGDMKYFVSALESELLDRAVQLALPGHAWVDNAPRPTSDWLDGGPLVEKFLLSTSPVLSAAVESSKWESSMYLTSPSKGIYCCGPTPLVSAMRCLVANLIGEEIDL